MDRQAEFERQVMLNEGWNWEDDWYFDEDVLEKIREAEYRMYLEDCREVYEGNEL